MSAGTQIVRGSCLCGAVRWHVAQPLSLMSHCHCSMCRKLHGAAFGTYVAAPGASFQWLSGETEIVRYQSSERVVRRFCGRCGSVVADPPDPEAALASLAWMPAGCLDDDPGQRPLAHIFIGSKAAWYEIHDSLRQYDAWPPGYENPVVPRAVQEPSEPGWVPGSCLCGAIAFELRVGAWTLMQCHCSRCRKGRAAAHGTNLFADEDQLRWTRGRDACRHYAIPEALRWTQAFCPTCGAKVPREAGAMRVVPAGCLDGDPGIAQRKHIFTGSKAPWFDIADNFPQFEALPPR